MDQKSWVRNYEGKHLIDSTRSRDQSNQSWESNRFWGVESIRRIDSTLRFESILIVESISDSNQVSESTNFQDSTDKTNGKYSTDTINGNCHQNIKMTWPNQDVSRVKCGESNQSHWNEVPSEEFCAGIWNSEREVGILRHEETSFPFTRLTFSSEPKKWKRKDEYQIF